MLRIRVQNDYLYLAPATPILVGYTVVVKDAHQVHYVREESAR
jgi:hypothetical protein